MNLATGPMIGTPHRRGGLSVSLCAGAVGAWGVTLAASEGGGAALAAGSGAVTGSGATVGSAAGVGRATREHESSVRALHDDRALSGQRR